MKKGADVAFSDIFAAVSTDKRERERIFRLDAYRNINN
jgi:hypothetical protein